MITTIPPFWGFLLGASLLVILFDISPRIGGALLVIMVLSMLLLYEQNRKKVV